MHQTNRGEKMIDYLRIFGLAAAVWIGLANFAFVPHWINEMIGATSLNTKLPEEAVFASIFVFAVTLAFLFFNRLYAIAFELFKEAAS